MADAMSTRVRILSGHTDSVRGAAFSPDGRTLATGANDGTIRLWDVATCESRVLSGHTGMVTAVAFSPSADALVSASHDTTARLWDPATGACTAVLDHPWTPGYPGDMRRGVTAVCFSRDARLLATQMTTPALYLWDLATMSSRRLEGLKKPWGASIDISPDGLRLSAATLEKTARIWDTATGKNRLLKGHTGKDVKVARVRFAPDGRFLATAARYDPATFVWDLATRAGIALTSTSRGAVTASHAGMAVSPDAAWLARENHDGTVEIWDVSDASLRRAGSALAGISLIRTHSKATRALCFSPDSRLLATADVKGDVVVSEVPSGRTVVRAELPSWPGTGIYAPDGARLAFTVQKDIALIDL